jgi:hypothetical protein
MPIVKASTNQKAPAADAMRVNVRCLTLIDMLMNKPRAQPLTRFSNETSQQYRDTGQSERADQLTHSVYHECLKLDMSASHQNGTGLVFLTFLGTIRTLPLVACFKRMNCYLCSAVSRYFGDKALSGIPDWY